MTKCDGNPNEIPIDGNLIPILQLVSKMYFLILCKILMNEFVRISSSMNQTCAHFCIHIVERKSIARLYKERIPLNIKRDENESHANFRWPNYVLQRNEQKINKSGKKL